MYRLPKIFLVLSFAASAAACGGGNSGFLMPTDTALNPFVAPETDELIAEDESEEEYEEYEDEEEEETPTPTPTVPTTDVVK
ncbi:MAG: hypothetical protein JKY56_01740 [Kofleriaceae bacterium]|nr:hypothetical protein [Kofleriaceae bacterium]